jgi:hypothetical protein
MASTYNQYPCPLNAAHPQSPKNLRPSRLLLLPKTSFRIPAPNLAQLATHTLHLHILNLRP